MVVAAQSWFSFDRDKVTATVKILAGAGHLWGWAISVSEKKKKKKKKKREEISSYHEKNMSWIQWKHDIDVFYQR